MLSLVKYFERGDSGCSDHLLPLDLCFLVLSSIDLKQKAALNCGWQTRFWGQEKGKVIYLNHYLFPPQNLRVNPTPWKSTRILVLVFMGSGFHSISMPAHLCCCPPHCLPRMSNPRFEEHNQILSNSWVHTPRKQLLRSEVKVTLWDSGEMVLNIRSLCWGCSNVSFFVREKKKIMKKCWWGWRERESCTDFVKSLICSFKIYPV